MAKNLAEAIKKMNVEELEGIIFVVTGRINPKDEYEAFEDLKTRNRTRTGLTQMLEELREQVKFGTDFLVIHILRD